MPPIPVVVEVGLFNVRNNLNAEPSEYLGHDAISDGPESCPLTARAEDDPLKGRPPYCSEISPPAPPTFSARPATLGVEVEPSACDRNAEASFELRARASVDRVDRSATFVDRRQATGYAVEFDRNASRDNARWFEVACPR